MMFAQGMFQVDPNSTPQQLAQKRAMIAALMPRFGSAKYVGEGIGQLATGVAIGKQNRQLDKIEGAGSKSANDIMSRLFGTANSASDPAMSGPLSVLGMQPQEPAPPMDPNSPQGIAGDTMAALGRTPSYRESLIGTESGGNWSAKNNETGAGGKKGHYGRVQFGHARLDDAKRAGVLPPDMTPEMFLASPEYQQRAEDWHFADLERELSPYVGAVVNGQTMDMGALVAMGHLGGAGGAKKYVESGGQYNPSDSFGTSLADYATTHGGGGGAAPAPTSAPQIPINELYMALQNPWLAPEQKALVQSMIAEQQQASDPLRQLELQKAQMEIDQMGAPAGPPEELVERQALAAAANLQPGTPEYQTYLLTGQLPEPPKEAKPYSSMGEIQADLRAGFITQEQAEMAVAKMGGGVTVNNNLAADDGEFAKAFAKGDADTIATVYNSGLAAQRNIGRIDQLDALLAASPTGFEGVAKQKAGEWGFETEGLDAIQSAQAVINALVPEQRQPGSGPMSDADLALFKQSLPRIINQPGGNQMIVGTMRAIAQYDAEGASIVQRLRSGELTRPQAFEALQNRKNPLADLAMPAPLPGRGATQGAGAVEDPAGFAAFSADPSAVAAAKQYGVTLEEMWEIKRGMK